MSTNKITWEERDDPTCIAFTGFCFGRDVFKTVFSLKPNWE